MVKTYKAVKTQSTEAEILPDAAEALRLILSRLPGAQVSALAQPRLPGGQSPDVIATLTYKGRQVVFAVEVKKLGEPQYAYAAFRQLGEYRRADPEAMPVFAAPYVSPETAKLCRRENIGYFDLSGNCEIAFGDVYIHIEGKPNLFVRPRSLRSLYQPKAERVLRVLLTGPIKPWRIQALAEEAKVSVGQAFKVKELLREWEWLTETEQGFLLTNPEDLLDDWALHYCYDKHHAVQYYTLCSIDDFAQIFSAECQRRNIPCAFTAFAAAARYAPYATYRKVSAYLPQQTAEVKELVRLPSLQLAPVETGADVTLLSPYDDGVFYGVQQRQELLLASPLQTYLDLQSTGGRGREAADVLLGQEVIPNW